MVHSIELRCRSALVLHTFAHTNEATCTKKGSESLLAYETIGQNKRKYREARLSVVFQCKFTDGIMVKEEYPSLTVQQLTTTGTLKLSCVPQIGLSQKKHAKF